MWRAWHITLIHCMLSFSTKGLLIPIKIFISLLSPQKSLLFHTSMQHFTLVLKLPAGFASFWTNLILK